MKKIDAIKEIEEIEDEDTKLVKYKNLSIRKLVISNIIVLITLLLILIFPKILLDLMPSILGEVGLLLLGSFILSGVFLVLFYFDSEIKCNKIKNYKFHKIFYKIYDYFSYFINTISIIYVVMICFATPSTVKGSSMENTLYHGNSVIVYHFFYKPKIDDIVVLHSNPYYHSFEDEENTAEGRTNYFVKRCKARKGDKIEFIFEQSNYKIKVNDIFIDNLLVDENIKNRILKSNDVVIEENIIKSNHVLVISDNKKVPTVDSRAMGFIKGEDIIGKVVFRFFPFTEIKIF